MKKIFKNLLVGITPMALLPLAMISCRREDYEDIKNDDPNNNQKKKKILKQMLNQQKRSMKFMIVWFCHCSKMLKIIILNIKLSEMN